MRVITLYIIALIITVAMVVYIRQLPIVYWSVSQDKCVRCEGCDCSNLPDRYERIWVR